MSPVSGRWWAQQAWVHGAWAADVLLQADAQGHWAAVQPGTPAPPDAERLTGPVLPALVNAHSHAFQRAFIGLAEHRDSERDDFWSWRDRMYGVALRITPEQLFDVAQHLYTELLAGGYTHTCEFHYLHHASDGRPYSAHGGHDLAMARALAEAAQATGMGLTLLPVLYERAGFTQPQLREDQRRFATDLNTVLRWREQVRGWALPQVTAGLALHSLRAVRPESLRELAALNAGDPGPLHIHVAEQTAEVDDCLAHTGHRPIAWLLHQGLLDARWQLVHATHTTPAEIDGVAASGAGVVLCPGTEANLGDGLCDLPRWLAAGVPLSLGSDSQVTRTWPEELRWLEYGQRLVLRQRNVAASPGRQPATAARLFEAVRGGGAAAAGLATWGLQVGARADFLVLDTADAALTGLPAARLLDATVFASPQRPFAAVYSAGRRRTAPPEAAERCRGALQGLWPA
ncbi:N-formylglutamate amidohydrolase [beta proteobacterium AAP121]|nr:N-formylglutamate amidohydrolase [beta proteobacterium AAP65]KPF97512.1 N-formylglutamate amidohydrolase [beta proteobacterium AAP121]